MPRYERLPRFDQDWQRLDAQDRARFKTAVARFVEDIEAGRPFRPGLRVKKVQGTSAVMEMTFAPDGRATWQFGAEVVAGQPHVVWRRVGAHVIFDAP